MKTQASVFLTVLAVLLFCRGAAASAHAAESGYTITATPTDLIIGEEFVVKWTVPFGTSTLDDWLGVFLVSSAHNKPITWKWAAFRGGETAFDAPEKRGNYECRYFEWNLLGGSRHVATSETLKVREPVPNPFLIRNYPPKGATLIAFGDSLAAGKGAKAGEDFPSRLSKKLGRPIVNAGVTGNTTEDALKRLESDVLNKEPKIVIVLLGGNDILRGKSPTQAIANLRTIIDRIHEKGACVILVGVQGGLFTDRLRDGLHQLAAETRVAYVPNILRGIIGNPFRMSDAVHPNARGYQLMADRIYPALYWLSVQRRRVLVNLDREAGKVKVSWFGPSDVSYRISSSGNAVSDFSPFAVSVETTDTSDGYEYSFTLLLEGQMKFFRIEEYAP